MLIPSGRLIKTFISCDKLTCCFRLEYVRYLWIDKALMNALVSIEDISKNKECLCQGQLNCLGFFWKTLNFIPVVSQIQLHGIWVRLLGSSLESR